MTDAARFVFRTVYWVEEINIILLWQVKRVFKTSSTILKNIQIHKWGRHGTVEVTTFDYHNNWTTNWWVLKFSLLLSLIRFLFKLFKVIYGELDKAEQFSLFQWMQCAYSVSKSTKAVFNVHGERGTPVKHLTHSYSIGLR